MKKIFKLNLQLFGEGGGEGAGAASGTSTETGTGTATEADPALEHVNLVLADMTRIVIGMNLGVPINMSSFTLIDLTGGSSTGTETGSSTETGSGTGTGTQEPTFITVNETLEILEATAMSFRNVVGPRYEYDEEGNIVYKDQIVKGIADALDEYFSE